MTNSNLLFVIIITITIIYADQTVERLYYKIDRNINSFAGGSSIHFEIIFNNSIDSMSIILVETEKRIYDCCLKIEIGNGRLHIYLKGNILYYPKVNVHLILHQPLSSIDLSGAAHLIMHNTMQIDTLSLKLSGASEAQVKVEVMSKLYVSISGASEMTMSGFVKGSAHIDVSGASNLYAQSCPMNTIYVKASGASYAYVIGKESVDISETGASVVDYEGPGNKKRSAGNWFRSLFSFNNAASKTLNKSMKYFFILFYMIYFLLC